MESTAAVAVAMHTSCPARHPSPKNPPFSSIATTASFPCGDRQRRFAAADLFEKRLGIKRGEVFGSHGLSPLSVLGKYGAGRNEDRECRK